MSPFDFSFANVQYVPAHTSSNSGLCLGFKVTSMGERKLAATEDNSEFWWRWKPITITLKLISHSPMPCLLSRFALRSVTLPSCPCSPHPHVYSCPFSLNITRWCAPDAIFTTTVPGNISMGFLSIPLDERPIVPLESCNKHNNANLQYVRSYWGKTCYVRAY